MDAERYDLRVYATESLNLGLTLYTDAAASTLWNLTGYTADFTVRTKPGATPVATLDTTTGITLGGTAGTITVTRKPDQHATWNLEQGHYTLRVISPSGDPTVILHGSLTFLTT